MAALCCGVPQVNMTLAMVFGQQFFHNIATTEWEVVRTDHERRSILYPCCPNPYVEIRFQLLLRRRPTFASHLFIAPSVILCLITPTIFILPPTSFEKLTFGKYQSSIWVRCILYYAAVPMGQHWLHPSVRLSVRRTVACFRFSRNRKALDF